MRIVCADGLEGNRDLAAPAIAEAEAAGHELTWIAEPINGDDDWVDRLDGADAALLLLGFPTTVFERLPGLQLISFAGTGTEQYVDVAAASAHGITVCNVPAYGANAVAEQALGLLFGVVKHLPAGDRTVRSGGWDHRPGRELRGMKLGVVGAGPIGARMLELGRAMGMETVAWTRNPTQERAAALGTTFVELDELMRDSDVVSVHLPQTPMTEGLIDASLLDLLAPQAIVINTARAGVMDTRHLASMLAAGRIYGAGIDVFDVEPPEDDPVIATGHAASVFSPHVGWDTPDAMTDLYRVAVDNIIRFAQGAPANVVAVAPV